MKIRRVTAAKLQRLEPSRQRLRDFSTFIETQDAEMLAGVVTMIDSTLVRLCQIAGFPGESASDQN